MRSKALITLCLPGGGSEASSTPPDGHISEGQEVAMPYRDRASFGKRQEYLVVAELLRRGFDVYMTLVDDQSIDCVLRLDDKRYLDIQI